MRIDVEALVRECIRWRAEPCLHSTFESAHRLLTKLPADQRVHLVLEWCTSREWQLVVSGKLVTSGSFEACVTALARLFAPQAVAADEASVG